MQTNPAVEPWNRSGRERKGLWRKGFAEEPSLEFSHPATLCCLCCAV